MNDIYICYNGQLIRVPWFIAKAERLTNMQKADNKCIARITWLLGEYRDKLFRMAKDLGYEYL